MDSGCPLRWMCARRKGRECADGASCSVSRMGAGGTKEKDVTQTGCSCTQTTAETVLAVFKSVMAIKILDFIFSCYSLKLMRKATWTLSCRIWEANGKFQRSSWFHCAGELNGGAAFPTGLCNCPGLQTAATALLTVVSLCLIGWPTGLR